MTNFIYLRKADEVIKQPDIDCPSKLDSNRDEYSKGTTLSLNITATSNTRTRVSKWDYLRFAPNDFINISPPPKRKFNLGIGKHKSRPYGF